MGIIATKEVKPLGNGSYIVRLTKKEKDLADEGLLTMYLFDAEEARQAKQRFLRG